MSDWTVGCSATVTVADDGTVSVSVHLEDLAGDVAEEGATKVEEAAVSAWLDANGTEHRVAYGPRDAREVMRTLDCSDCGVVRGQYCIKPNGAPTTEHSGRYEAAVAAGLLPLR